MVIELMFYLNLGTFKCIVFGYKLAFFFFKNILVLVVVFFFLINYLTRSWTVEAWPMTCYIYLSSYTCFTWTFTHHVNKTKKENIWIRFCQMTCEKN